MLKRGFTVIEMMIVVAIIGILIALAIPNFIHSREHVYRDMCINNLRQIKLAKAQWALENNKSNEEIPTPEPTIADLDPYIEDDITTGHKFICPLNQGGTFDSSYKINDLKTEPTCKINSGEHHL